MRGWGLAAVLAGAGGIVGACDKSASEPSEHACKASQTLMSSVDIHGLGMPNKTIALTFDDGPGPRTSELSSYLESQGVVATFFINGRMTVGRMSHVQQIAADGHLLANHTQTHVSLTGRSTGGAPLPAATIVSEVTETDAIIAPFVPGDRFLFRAPYGDFDGAAAAALNASPMNKYVGPIHWEIGDAMGPGRAADWDCWIPGVDGLVLSPEQCATLYAQEIQAAGRGIVLMHDPLFIGNDPALGGTVDMVKYLVPLLKAAGFTFVRCDDVPEVAAFFPTSPLDAGPDGDASRPPAVSGPAKPPAETPPDRPAATPEAIATEPDPDPCATP